MAFFGLSDISFNKGGNEPRKGPLASLVDSKFETTTLRYPADLGNYDKGHYIVFYIREQKNTQYKATPAGSDTVPITQSSNSNQVGSAVDALRNPQSLATQFGNQIMGKVNSGLNQINQATGGQLGGITSQLGKAAGGAIGGVVGGINNLFGQAGLNFGGSSAQTSAVLDNNIKRITGGGLKFLRTTTLTTDAIALYMPDTLLFNYSQSYDNLSLGNEVLGQIAAAGSSAIEKAMKEGNTESLGGLIKGAVEGGKSLGTSAGLFAGSEAASKLGGSTGQAAFAAVAGVVRNPMLEMIYRSPNFRTFQFDFMFYPRDEGEALEVQRILERFRFHQAPELLAGASGFLIPPSEFEIKFYYGGGENSNIPQIATCILTTIDINYAPNGWSAYEIPGENTPRLGRTGMPVAIQLTLQFQEITYLTKADYRKDLAQGTRASLGDKM